MGHNPYGHRTDCSQSMEEEQNVGKINPYLAWMHLPGPSLSIPHQSEAKCHTLDMFTPSCMLLIAWREQGEIDAARQQGWARAFSREQQGQVRGDGGQQQDKKAIKLINDAGTHKCSNPLLCWYVQHLFPTQELGHQFHMYTYIMNHP